MKCICTKENLYEGLTQVGHVTSRTSSLPILNNILFRIEHGVITLSATNLEIGITRLVRGKVESEGAITIPARILTEYVGLLANDEAVTLELDGNRMTVTSKAGSVKLNTMPAEEYPLIPKLEKQGGGACDAAAFKEALQQVLFAVANDDARPEISGVLFRVQGRELTLVSTDSYRLAEKKIALKEDAPECTTIIPARTMAEVLHMLDGGAAALHWYATENQMLFSHDETDLVTRLIDGQYPQFEQIVPKGHATRATIDRDALLRAVKATSLFARPGIHDVALSFAPPGTLVLESSNTQVGENRQELAATIEGKENAIVLNGRYLLDGLANLGMDEAVLELTNNASPAVFRHEKGRYLYIIMPIKQ